MTYLSISTGEFPVFQRVCGAFVRLMSPLAGDRWSTSLSGEFTPLTKYLHTFSCSLYHIVSISKIPHSGDNSTSQSVRIIEPGQTKSKIMIFGP